MSMPATANVQNKKLKVCDGLGTLRQETIAQRRSGCSLPRVRVNGLIIHPCPGGRTDIVTL